MKRSPFLLALLFLSFIADAAAGELHVGAATADITPDRPVGLTGHRRVRISKNPTTPIQASAVALESRDGDRALDQAIMVSCDLVAIRGGILEQSREKLAERLPGFPVEKMFLSATHTHAAPVMIQGRYALPDKGIMQPTEFVDFATTRIAEAAEEAWKSRAPGKAAWGWSQAVIAQNRRPFYADGTAQMYGKTDRPDFRGIEGYEDHSVDVLFFWNQSDKLLATVVNIPSPSQEMGGSSLHADYWAPTRRMLREKHGEDLHIVAWTGAAGDATSRPLINRAAEARMRKLRGGIERLDFLASRIVRAWEEALEGAANDKRGDVVLRHEVKTIELPYRVVTKEERDEAEKEAAQYADDPAERWNWRWNNSVVERYEAQQAGTQEPYVMELHALRLGDVAIGTNAFELYTDFGIQMKARSPGVQTFVVQLSGAGTYLPSERAVSLGGYGAVIQSSRLGPKAGQVLVDETVAAWKELWKE